MKLKKQDFQIVFENHDRFGILMRKRFLKFFSKWVPVTSQEAENAEEVPVTFPTFDEAVGFIETITQ